MAPRRPGYDLRACSLSAVADMCRRHHGYRGAGGTATYSFAVVEDGRIVAAYAWQPPARGAALSACPEAPGGVLALSRMVAVPRAERALNHVSKPLRRQMRVLMDRGRWPVLVTYSDEGQGHTGHVYRCSGWEATRRSAAPTYEDAAGARRSSYSNGRHRTAELTRAGTTVVQRWEHWACPRGAAATWMEAHGWRRVPVPGRTWRSGNQAYTWTRQIGLGQELGRP